MATRSDMVFFPPPAKSLVALRLSTLEVYLKEFPATSDILEALGVETDDRKRKEHHLDISHLTNLDKPAPELLASQLDLGRFGDLSAQPYPDEFSALTEKIDFYMDVLCDVLYNQLADAPYEVIDDREFVREREHALQAAKIALLINLPFAEVLSLLFHDIARPSVKNVEEGHRNHCRDGAKIMQPLGLSTYTAFHAIAKDLLFKLCPPYAALISGTSEKSLKIQRDHCIAEQREALKRFEKDGLIAVSTRVMFLRFLDDLAKVPMEEIKKYLKPGEEPTYFTKDQIRQMLQKHMAAHLHHLKAESENIEVTVQTMKTNLDEALQLLVRARAFSNNPDLYRDNEHLCPLDHGMACS